MEDIKNKILNEATRIVLRETATNGKNYSECIDETIDKLCEKYGISEKEKILIFAR